MQSEDNTCEFLHFKVGLWQAFLTMTQIQKPWKETWINSTIFLKFVWPKKKKKSQKIIWQKENWENIEYTRHI